MLSTICSFQGKDHLSHFVQPVHLALCSGRLDLTANNCCVNVLDAKVLSGWCLDVSENALSLELRLHSLSHDWLHYLHWPVLQVSTTGCLSAAPSEGFSIPACGAEQLPFVTGLQATLWCADFHRRHKIRRRRRVRALFQSMPNVNASSFSYIDFLCRGNIYIWSFACSQ